MTESTEQTIDEAMVNLEEGKAGDPVSLPPTETVEEQAVKYLMWAIPMFRTKLKALEEHNRTEVGRVLSALIESPLEQETHHFTSDKAQDLFELGLVITNAKLILFNKALTIESVVEEATRNAVDQSNEPKKEEQA